jgi:hypothetical protein
MRNKRHRVGRKLVHPVSFSFYFFLFYFFFVGLFSDIEGTSFAASGWV